MTFQPDVCSQLSLSTFTKRVMSHLAGKLFSVVCSMVEYSHKILCMTSESDLHSELQSCRDTPSRAICWFDLITKGMYWGTEKGWERREPYNDYNAASRQLLTWIHSCLTAQGPAPRRQLARDVQKEEGWTYASVEMCRSMCKLTTAKIMVGWGGDGPRVVHWVQIDLN